MKTRLQKWSNSLVLRIPKAFAAELGLANESTVEVYLVKRKLVITPVTQPELRLKTLLTQVSEDNLHHEVDTGAAMGNELW